MCGIAGSFSFDAQEVSDAAAHNLTAQIATLHHRGPDAQGIYNGPGIGLAHARLSIIDLSEGANQPMENDSGSIQLVFNGEIYNFPELRKQLRQKGCQFRTNSDTEVIVRDMKFGGGKL